MQLQINQVSLLNISYPTLTIFNLVVPVFNYQSFDHNNKKIHYLCAVKLNMYV